MSSGEAVGVAPPRDQLRWRLVPGCHLYRADDGGWRALTPEGRFIRLRGADAVLSDVAQALTAQTQPGPQARDVLAELGRRGLVERPEQQPRIASRVVLVAGENELYAAVIRCLRPWVQLLYQPASGDDEPETEWIADADVAAADAGGVLVLAGLIVADVLAYLAGRVPPSAGYQLAFNPTTSALDRHPVLLLPALWTDEDP